MIHIINFGTEEYKKAQQLNTKTAKKHGADCIHEFSISDIDDDFYNENKIILDKKRGSGYWLWKPYFIDKVMKESIDDDWIVYADSGMYYRRNIKLYINELEMKKIDFISRTTKFKEKEYMKRDVFIELGCDVPEFTDTLQRAASAIVLKNTEHNREIITKWLEYCQNVHWITDEPNINELDNYKEFVDHRHDQSLFSLVCKQNNVPYNQDLFLDILYVNKSKALLVDHHTKYGNKCVAYIMSIKRGFEMIFGEIKRLRRI